MIEAYNDWELGIHPVSTGEAPWLPGPYREAVRAVRAAVNQERAARAADPPTIIRGKHAG